MDNGEFLKKARKKLGFSQQALANYFEVERRLISYWEQGQRTIPKGVLKMARQAKRMNKKDAMCHFKQRSLNCEKECSNRVKSVPKNTGIEKGGGNTHRDSSLFQTLGEKNSQNTQSETLDTFIQPKKEDSVFSPPKEGSMEELILESYIEFRKKHNRFPVDTDFINSEFKEATKNEVLQCFGSLGEAKKLANKLKRYRIAEQREEKIIRIFPSPSEKVKPPLGDKGFSCPCCGRKWRGINDFYNVLRKVIKEKLSHIEQNPRSYQITVLRLMAFLFGTQEIKGLGYDVGKLENSDTCFCGGQFKPDWHSSFKTILTKRFLNLLQSTDGQGPEEAMEDCTVAVLGRKDE